MKKHGLLALLMVALLPLAGFAGAQREAVTTEEASAEDYVAAKLAGALTLAQMQEYRALPSYSEAPALTEMVRAGKLPSVKDRLPREPLVLKGTMIDGPGKYGGVWRAAWGSTVSGWNWAAGVSRGWFGINQNTGESLVATGPMWALKEPEPVPNLARSWEWSSDGKALTMHLIEGASWSDGHPFTADDILFTYNDNILDPQVTSWKTASDWTFGGKVTDLEKVDDYTIRWHFGEPYPLRVFFLMDTFDFDVSPAHVYRQFHPKYNNKMDYEDFANVGFPDATPVVGMSPWVPILYKAEQVLVLVRNPYFWMVDEQGQQLPYLDELWFVYKGSDTGRTTAFLAGEVDMTNSANPKMFSMLLEKEQDPGSPFRLVWDEPHIAFRLILNQSMHVGIKDDRDRALREMNRNVKFRQAISHIIDREGIVRALFPGPQLMPWYGAYPMGSLFWDENYIVKYPYDLEKAKSLLGELGFRDTNGDGILNWPAGTAAAGLELVIPLNLGDSPQQTQIGELLEPLFRDAGISLKLDILQGPIAEQRMNAGEWAMAISRTPGAAAPDQYPEEVGPASAETPDWHMSGPGGRRDLQPFEREIQRLFARAAVAREAEERMDIFLEVSKLSTENVYTVPIYQYQAAYGHAKRFRNIPGDLPARLYQWNWTNLRAQQVWSVAPIKSEYQGQIPTAEDYAARIERLKEYAAR
jgi:peptide/nickel transport system substrate-binding protein